MERKVNIITDLNGKKTVFIQDILFKKGVRILSGRKWKNIKRYIGEFIENTESGDIIYIGADLPDEYAGSKDTAKLIVRHSSDQKALFVRYYKYKKRNRYPFNINYTV